MLPSDSNEERKKYTTIPTQMRAQWERKGEWMKRSKIDEKQKRTKRFSMYTHCRVYNDVYFRVLDKYVYIHVWLRKIYDFRDI